MFESNIFLVGKYSMYSLREVDPKLPSLSTIFDYPMRGEFLSLKDVEEYCLAQKWQFRKDSSIYGGYFVEPSTGRSFIVV